MSPSQKICLVISFIYLSEFVQSYKSRSSPICTKTVYDDLVGYTKVRYCCDGYLKDTRYTRFLKCNPVCSTGCPNGRCVYPEVCYCNIGYTIDTASSRCVPKCSDPCYNGECVRPETCRCHPGFRELNSTYCEPISPICSPSCFNGDCVAPNKCKCHDGYEPSGWGVLDTYGFDYTCLPHSTTSTTTTTPTITSIGEDEMTKTVTSETVEYSYIPTEVTDQEADDNDVTETITETKEYKNFATQDDYEFTSETDVTDGVVPVTVILYKAFTELDDNSRDDKNKKSGIAIWIYIAAAILLVTLLILMVVAFRRKVLGCIKGRTYVVQDQETRKASNASHTFNVTFSSTSHGK